MTNYAVSKQLIKNIKNFLTIKYYSFFDYSFSKSGVFYGWGRKASGQKAVTLAKKFDTSFVLLEDGFIRSLGLGTVDNPSFSIVEDNEGIYYDATQPSKLENILNMYDFSSDSTLMKTAFEAINYMKEHGLSKYNNAPDIDADFFKEDMKQKILIIAQTAGDASLQYGRGEQFKTDEIILSAIKENPDASVYIKIHPDVLSGKKSSDMDTSTLPKECKVITEDVNPMSLLKYFDKVYTKTSGMGFEALLSGKEVVCFGMPFYSGWGLTDDKITCDRRKRKLTVEEVFAGAYILYTKYYNPYSKKQSSITDTLETIHKYSKIYKQNEGNLYFFGFSRWKRRFTIPFFNSLKKNNMVFCATLENGLKKGLSGTSNIYIWGKKPFPEVEQYVKDKKIALHRVEDGFIRSVGLGSDLTQPYSFVIDTRGIYFDPTQESDLEHLLNFHDFTEEEVTRAKRLRQYLVEKKLSKYNNYNDVDLHLPEDKKIVFVPGQVEDDASIRFGAKGMTNLELLKVTRKHVPDAYIVFKPHPDVLVGNRIGDVAEVDALKYCNRVVTEVSLDSVLRLTDEVHTMTSLVGFEALMRGIKVHTYGIPFYAGWGLSEDVLTCARRQRVLTIDELTAAALLLYPRYIDPLSKKFCEIEVTLEGLEREKERLENSGLYLNLMKIRNLISRKSQLFLRFFK